MRTDILQFGFVATSTKWAMHRLEATQIKKVSTGYNSSYLTLYGLS